MLMPHTSMRQTKKNSLTVWLVPCNITEVDLRMSEAWWHLRTSSAAGWDSKLQWSALSWPLDFRATHTTRFAVVQDSNFHAFMFWVVFWSGQFFTTMVDLGRGCDSTHFSSVPWSPPCSGGAQAKPSYRVDAETLLVCAGCTHERAVTKLSGCPMMPGMRMRNLL